MTKTLLCSPENFTHLQSQIPPGQSLQAQLGTPVRVDRFVPTWKEYPRPKWWRRWFLREKQKPKERVFWVVDFDAFEKPFPFWALSDLSRP
jgi:hypothetical protein